MPKISKFTGLNNVAKDASLAGPGDFQTATNVFVDDDRSFKMRAGTTLLAAASVAAHSVNGDSGSLLYVDSTSLLLHGTPSPTVLATVTAGAAMGYMWLNGKLYYGNGTQNGVFASGAVRSLGLTAPPSPVVAPISGGLHPGKYQVALTYIRADGQESGTSTPVTCTVANGGIRISSITASSDSGVAGIVVYLSSGEALMDGGGLYRYITLPNTSTAISVVNYGSVGMGWACKTHNTYPPPKSTIMFFYRGRAYYVNGSTLTCSLPLMFENVHLDRGAWTFESAIRFAVPVENGIWVGTATDVMFLAGDDPYADGGFKIKSRSKLVALAGAVAVNSSQLTVREFDPRGLCAIMGTGSGIFVGDGNGQLVDYTGHRWVPPSTTGGFGFVDDTQYVFLSGGVVYTMNMKNGAVCKSDRVFNSMTHLGTAIHAGHISGVLTVTGTNDSAVAIPVTLEKQGVSFGSSLIKTIPEMYLHMANDAAVTLTISADVGNGTASSPAPAGSTMRTHRIKPPRGVRGRNFTLNFVAASSTVMHLAEIEAMVLSSPNRHV